MWILDKSRPNNGYRDTKNHLLKISIMSFKKIVSPQFLIPFFFLSFILVSCADTGTSFKFPDPNREVWCTYDVTFEEGTSPSDMEKEKERMKNEVVSGVRSAADGIQCDPQANWLRIDDLHWQLEVTVHCFRLSDTSTVRPPTATKPPPSRVSGGTVVKSGCPEDDIKK